MHLSADRLVHESEVAQAATPAPARAAPTALHWRYAAMNGNTAVVTCHRWEGATGATLRLGLGSWTSKVVHREAS